MRVTPRIIACLAVVGSIISASHAQGQGMAPMAPAATGPSASVLQFVQRFEGNFMAAAQAMPADKYLFAPSNPDVFKAGSPAQFATVRTFANQIAHVIGESYRNLAPFGVKPDPDVDLKAIDAMTDKASILKALQASFDYQNKVIGTMTADNALTPTGPRGVTMVSALVSILNDDGDHYGQMVEYLRMNGIIPPATERQMQARPAAAPMK
jgi:hypothetical protein